MDNYKNIIGKFGESLAKDFLVRRGYKIVSTNHRIGRLEIDIVTRLNGSFVFIEVKTRKAASAGPAQDALKSSQIKDLKRAISAYCRQKNININLVRLDLVSVDLRTSDSTAKIQHFIDIF